MTYSTQREEATLRQCDSIVAALDTLEREIKAGPRLTVSNESERDAALKSMRAIYANIALHCRRNLYP